MGAAPVIMSRTRPPRLACRGQQATLALPQHNEQRINNVHTGTLRYCGSWANAMIFRDTLTRWALKYLDFPEDESIPDAVPPHDAPQHLDLFPPEGQVQQPALQRAVSLSEDLDPDTNITECFWSNPPWLKGGFQLVGGASSAGTHPPCRTSC